MKNKREKKENKYSRILKSKQQKTGNLFNIYLYNFTQLTVTDNNRRKLLTMPITKLTLQGK